ncbi:hypothetical protein VKT23_017827 [Stygiomarasmius scandens]|uniref:MYND-type domain-containing protein n=1 Tax=Marasmiellus scandens TaxID=2682957 RepID=A0ABR1IQW5_9AGAR
MDLEDLDLPGLMIGGFVFCTSHGSEFCNKCQYDGRLVNNEHIMRALKKAFPGEKKDSEKFWRRPLISNVYNICTPSKTKIHPVFGLPLVECNLHKDAECRSCFNWEGLVISQMKLSEGLKNPSAIPVYISRPEKIQLLASMGVELSLRTRIPDLDLDKRLRGAIDASQNFEKLIGRMNGFDLSNLGKWPRSSTKSLLKAVSRSNPAESITRIENDSTEPRLYQNSFDDVRQTLMSLGYNWDNRCDCCMVEDKEEENGICVRVVNVLILNDDTPIFIVLYRRGLRCTPVQPILRWFDEMKKHGLTAIVKVQATPQEQNLLLTILERNAESLSPAYRPKRRVSEEEFELSFLLPMAPLSQQSIIHLSTITGCMICGNEASKKCSQCHVVDYCGTVCQSVDWKDHKQTCRAIKIGKWMPFKVSMEPEELREARASGKKLSMMNWSLSASPSMDNIQETRSANDSNPAPPNLYGDKPFLIKVQRPVINNGSAMMIYDQKRSAQFWLVRGDDPVAYDTALEEIKSGPRGLKIYRWAKRIGDLELSVCIDKAPPKVPQW